MATEPLNDKVFDSGDESIYDVATTGDGPGGALPLDEDQLRNSRSGDLFGWTQNVAMGLNPKRLRSKEFLILSTKGGLRAPDGSAIALGYHTGHWEVGLLVEEAANELTALGDTPFAAYVSDPCDGRTNGTVGMLDSLPYRNDAAVVMRRLIRSLPTASGVLGIASCDKGLPATLMALAGVSHLPGVAVPGGVTLKGRDAEDAGSVQTLSARFARGEITLEYAADIGCRACGSAGGGCQFMGTAATSQVVAEALGLALPHSALCPSGAPIWRDLARRSARALHDLAAAGTTTADILSDDSIHNAMVLHAAVGGSTNLVLHIPAIAHAAGLRRPEVADWEALNRSIPRLVDALPNGPEYFATVQVFLAGGVPEVMLRLAELGVLRLDAKTVTGRTLGENLEWWEASHRRQRLKAQLTMLDGVDPDSVIRPLSKPLPSTVTFLRGDLAPEGALVKSTAISPDLIDEGGVYRHEGPVKVYTSEDEAIAAIKTEAISPGDVMVLCGIGPGIGMPETYQITAALKAVDTNGKIPLLTDGRFSGVSTGPCVGHISPEAWAGGPIGRLVDGDVVSITIDTRRLTGSIEVVSISQTQLAARSMNPKLLPSTDVPDDTRLWAALQSVGGGSWGGCVYDVDAIIDRLS